MPRLLVLAALLAASQPAFAGGPPGMVLPESPQPTTHTEKYGWQIFLADAGWLAATVAIDHASQASDGSNPGSMIALGYFLTGPIVHLAHGNSSGATRSIAARALLPMGGALVGLVYGSGDGSEYGALGGMVIGGGLGMVGAMVLDWTVLGKHEVADAPRTPYAIAPGVSFAHGGAQLSLAGRF